MRLAHRSRCPRMWGLGRQEVLNARDECGRCMAVMCVRPLHFAKAVRYAGGCVFRVVDYDRDQERNVLGHVTGTFYCQPPLTTKIPFLTGVRVRGDDRHEQCTVMDLLANLAVPGVAAS